MRSGNGKHRRPRQAPAIVVAAGVTGSAIAIPLLGASGANAADADTWNRVAECESGGAWSADFGNGLYGGLQFSQATWAKYGGTAYAERPDLASRSQQIAVAEKVVAAEGPMAWPGCAVISGLKKGDRTDPGVDPGATPAPTTPAKPAERSEEAPAKPGEAPKPTGSKAAEPPAAPADEPAAGKHRGSPSPEEPPAAPDAAQDGRSTDPKASRGSSGRHAAPTTPAAPKDSAAPTNPDATDIPPVTSVPGEGDGSAPDAGSGGEAPAPADGEYTVRPGDNLWSIADEHRVPGGWPALYEANRAELGTDPDLILPGQNLELGKEAAKK
ncbi:transglycosylase family protein [Streptomyces sp. NPDC050504]|uniref:transglycosylase family protein n=1 Tax=Streptomyces sp. NPDC050504 TaxID=3365618 RepID=UPI0037AAC44C